MAKSLQHILGGRNLTRLITQVRDGVPAGLVPPALFTPTDRAEGDDAVVHRVKNTRRTARSKPYGAKAQTRDKQDLEDIPAKLIHTVESVDHGPTTLMNLKAPGSEGRQQLGRQEVARQTAEFGRLFVNLRRAAVYSVIANGKVWFDGDGELLPNSTGAVKTVDMAVPAGNQNQLDWDGGGDIIDASWATAGTKIITHVRKIKTAARQLTGLPLRHALYGQNLPDYFLTNTQTKELMNRDPALRTAVASGELPQGFLGFQWWPVDEVFFEDKDGTNQTMFGVDSLTLLPEVSTDWWNFVQGTYPVPNSINVSSDATGSLNNFTVTAGMFSYSTVTVNPPNIEHVAGDTFLPWLVNPKAIFQADVTP